MLSPGEGRYPSRFFFSRQIPRSRPISLPATTIKKERVIASRKLSLSGKPDSNWRPRVPQTRTLTTCAIARRYRTDSSTKLSQRPRQCQSETAKDFVSGPRIDPWPRQGEVIFDRIVGRIEGELPRHLDGVAQVRRTRCPRLAQESQPFAAGFYHMDIERNEEARRGKRIPAARVDVVSARHPAQEQEESFAGRTVRRVGQEILADAGPGGA